MAGLTKREQAKIDRTNANSGTLHSQRFTIACKLADTPVTPRQASKFRRGWGKAFRATEHMSDDRIREELERRAALTT